MRRFRPGCASAAQRDCVRSMLEIFHSVQIANETRTSRPPSQPSLRQRARSWNVGNHKVREPTKVLARLLRRLGDDRHLQPPADYLSDLSQRHYIFSNRVIPDSFRIFFGRLLQRQPVETRGIKSMRRRPAIEAIAHISRDALLARQSDQVSDKPLLDWIVDLRKAHYRNPHTRRCHGSCRLLRSGTRNRRIGRIFLGGQSPRRVRDGGSGGDDQGAIRASEGGAECLNRAPVDLTDFLESSKIVDESCVDHALRSSGTTAQAL